MAEAGTVAVAVTVAEAVTVTVAGAGAATATATATVTATATATATVNRDRGRDWGVTVTGTGAAIGAGTVREDSRSTWWAPGRSVSVFMPGAAHEARQPRGYEVEACGGGVGTPPAPKGGMNTETERPGAHRFVALELSLEIIESLRDVVGVIRKRDVGLAQQVVRSASSIAANLGEAGGRQGKDRLHFFRIAAGSAQETRVHLRVALAWDWVRPVDVEAALALIDRELAILWRLTH